MNNYYESDITSDDHISSLIDGLLKLKSRTMVSGVITQNNDNVKLIDDVVNVLSLMLSESEME